MQNNYYLAMKLIFMRVYNEQVFVSSLSYRVQHNHDFQMKGCQVILRIRTQDSGSADRDANPSPYVFISNIEIVYCFVVYNNE